MAFTKDQWTRPVEQQDGTAVRERNEKRWGRGKRWLGVWHDPGGRERSRAFDTKTKALRYASGMETDRDRGDYFDPAAGTMRLDTIGVQWLGGRQVDPATAIRYDYWWRLHVQPAFGARPVKSIRPSEIAVWVTGLNSTFGVSTARGGFAVLQGCLELAVADGILRSNPARSKVIKLPEVRRPKIVVWPDETVQKIVVAHPLRLRPIPIIAAACGLRQGELLGLAAEDIDFEAGVIHIRRQLKRLGKHYVFALPKNDRERIVPLSPSVARHLQHHLNSFPHPQFTLPWEDVGGEPVSACLLFRGPDGGCLKPRTYNGGTWRPAIAQAGVIPAPTRDARGRLAYIGSRKDGIHALRHYYASVTLADGVNIKELAEYLGHRSAAFTLEHYQHLLPSSHERARSAVDNRLARIGLADPTELARSERAA
jgi:integrase